MAILRGQSGCGGRGRRGSYRADGRMSVDEAVRQRRRRADGGGKANGRIGAERANGGGKGADSLTDGRRGPEGADGRMGPMRRG